MKTNKADFWFSRYIRIRDADENGIAKCCTCWRYVDIRYLDCGHFIKRQHQNTRFDEMNGNSQCKKCNAFEQGRDADYERFLIDKYGADKVFLLKTAGIMTKRVTNFELDQIAKYYKEKAIQLSKEKNIPIW